jgi:hypothetical protein
LLPRRGTLASSPQAIRWGWCPHHILAHWSEPESAKGTSRRGWPGQKPVDPAGWATSCARDRRHVVAPPTPVVVVVARAVVVVVVDALSPSSSLDRVPGVTVGPEPTPNRRCRGRDSLPLSLLQRRGWFRTVGRWHSGSPALRVLSRGRAFHLLCCHSLE